MRSNKEVFAAHQRRDGGLVITQFRGRKNKVARDGTVFVPPPACEPPIAGAKRSGRATKQRGGV